MSSAGRLAPAIAPAVVLLLVFHGQAEAYVDPGSGSMLVQLILGGLMAGLVMIRTWWHRIRGRLPRRSARGYAEEK
jgi:hypothetical protein